MKKIGIVLFAALIGWCIAGSVLAQQYPQPAGFVNDYVGLLPRSSVVQLERIFSGVQRETSAQIAICIVNSVQPFAIEEYAVGLFEKWGIGMKGKDNGILLLVAVQDRQFRIEVGYGFEDVIPDAIAHQIASQIITPAFKQGNYQQGLEQASFFIVSKVFEKYDISMDLKELVQDSMHDTAAVEHKKGNPIINILFFILMVYLFIRHPWLFFFLMMSGMGGGRRGYSGGSFGGSGFGGFGGGLSGGGGASGRW